MTYSIPAAISERMADYRKFLGPLGFQRFEEWMREEYRRGQADVLDQEVIARAVARLEVHPVRAAGSSRPFIPAEEFADALIRCIREVLAS